MIHMKKRLLYNLYLILPAVIWLMSGQQTAGAQTVVINEMMSSNQQTVLDEDGDSPDWVELFNASSSPVDLLNWSLTDDSLETDKWFFPQVTLQPGQFLLVFASDKDRKQGPFLHTSFRLGAGREPVLLYNAAGQRVDAVMPVCIPTGFSYGRQPDGVNLASVHLITPTPALTNNLSQTVTITPGKDTVLFSRQGGFYGEDFQLTLSAQSPETRIFYTTDGAVPDESATEYTQPIDISIRAGTENVLSEIETSPEWTPPTGEVFKTNVIRAVAYIDGCPASPVFTHSYFVEKNVASRYTFPVISITTDRSDFFGKKKGIYVLGENDGLGENFFMSGKEWERPIHLEFYDPDGKLAFKQNLGARIHGRGSRQNPQKSVRVYAREEYGKEAISYRIFPDLNIERFKTLILRTPSADFSSTLFKDELSQAIIGNMNIDLQASRPSVVFLNGEYWGIHAIRERQDKHYIASHYDVDPENLDMLGLSLDGNEIIEGDEVHYNAMTAFIESHSLQDEDHYQYVTTQMDVDNFIDYQIAQLFLANFDWPTNNVRFWRPKTPGGKWRWLFFDCDACMIQDKYKNLQQYVARENMDNKPIFLLRNLLKNQTFRSKFLSRFMYHLNVTFAPDRVIGFIDAFKQLYSPMVLEHVHRWNDPKAYNVWIENLEEIRLFALQRPVEMLRQLKQLYKMPFTVFPNPNNGRLNIKMEGESDIAVTVKLYNLKGQRIYERSYTNTAQVNDSTIDIADQPSGLYLLQLQYGNLIFIEKIVVN